MDILQQLVPVLYLILASIYIVGAVMGVIFFVCAERQRGALLKLRDVEREAALADLRVRREAAGKDYAYDSLEAVKAAIGQIVLDVLGEQQELSGVELHLGRILALVALGLGGSEFVLTPAPEAFLKEFAGQQKKLKGSYPVNGLVSTLFVVEELGAMARFFNAAVLLPRTEQWHLLVLASAPRLAVRNRRWGLRWSGLFGTAGAKSVRG